MSSNTWSQRRHPASSPSGAAKAAASSFPVLGIAAHGVGLTPTVASAVGQLRAVRVHAVAADSPASAARIQAADLLLGANETVLFSVDDLQRVLVLSRGAEVNLRLIRDGQPLSLSIKPELKRKAA